jgi:hypothetical protein
VGKKQDLQKLWDNLTNRQKTIAPLLLQGLSYSKVADALDGSVKLGTIHLWMRQGGNLKKYLDAEQKEMVDGVKLRVTALADKATDKLDGLLDSDKENIRLKAVKQTYDALSMFINLDVVDRVEELERLTEELKAKLNAAGE